MGRRKRYFFGGMEARRTLHVSGISKSTKLPTLLKHFQMYGKILRCFPPKYFEMGSSEYVKKYNRFGVPYSPTSVEPESKMEELVQLFSKLSLEDQKDTYFYLKDKYSVYIEFESISSAKTALYERHIH